MTINLIFTSEPEAKFLATVTVSVLQAFLSGIAAVRDYKLAALEKYQAALEGVGQGKPLSEVSTHHTQFSL